MKLRRNLLIFVENKIFPISAAVAWVAAHPGVTAPIVGARSAEQLQASLDSVKIDMTPELRAQITALSRAPGIATDRTDELKPST
jgi:aryl-alcohol dehydrogenase-like predicted oxidoreductase